MRPAIALLTCPFAAGCGFGDDGYTAIDGSNQEAFERTLGKAKSDLGPQDRVKFEAALAEFRARKFAKADTRPEYQTLVREGERCIRDLWSVP